MILDALSALRAGAYAASGAHMVLVARDHDALIHEVGPGWEPACQAATSGAWRLVRRCDATGPGMVPCTCCPRGDR